MIFYNNNYYFQNLLLRTFLLTKLNVFNPYDLPKFEKIKCSIRLSNLKTLTDFKILNSLEILELVSSKKPKITKISSGFFKNVEIRLNLRQIWQKGIYGIF